MKKFLISSFLILALTGCGGEETPEVPPAPAQPENKWGDKFEPAVKQCAQTQQQMGFPEPVATWETACRCLFQVAASRWTYEEYQNNPSYDQQLIQEKVQENCLKSSGLSQYAP